ncbi:Protein of unknown function DUF3468 [Penicillium cf. griseofulvum]|nr:Protein of unknown function DUF3468 [Penicillium cf. griseofulvum]
MPLSWDPRRMWSDNPSAAGASKDLPNEEIVSDSSPKAVSTAFAARSDSPKCFRFVKGVSRPKKRRRANSPKDQASRSVVTETSPEIVVRSTPPNLEVVDDHQRVNGLAGPELQDGHFFDDFGLFDSLLPNIFASTPFVDIEPQETLAAEVSGLSQTPRMTMTPLSPVDRAVDPVLHNLQTSSMAHSTDPMFRDEQQQNVLGDMVPRTIHEPTVPYASARLQVCPLRYRELVNSPDAGTLSAPSPWRPKCIDDTSH